MVGNRIDAQSASEFRNECLAEFFTPFTTACSILLYVMITVIYVIFCRPRGILVDPHIPRLRLVCVCGLKGLLRGLKPPSRGKVKICDFFNPYIGVLEYRDVVDMKTRPG